MDALTHARDFATWEHDGRRGQRHGAHPYSHHLAAVEAVLLRFGCTDDALRVAAWLHDVVEDCGIPLADVRATYGAEVAALVGAVTDEPGPNRKTRKAATYAKTRALPAAVLLKLADRIANVEAGGRLVAMYRKEHDAFRRALRSEAPSATEDAMWAHLDALLSPA